MMDKVEIRTDTLNDLLGAFMQLAEWADGKDLGMKESILQRHDYSAETWAGLIAGCVRNEAGIL